MGTDNLFKKRREERKERKHDFKQSKANSFLIVTEGERTEPLYLKGLQKKIIEKIGGAIEVIDTSMFPTIDVFGEGCSTGKLIDVTDRIVKEAKIIYQNVWVVFDKDDFTDFNTAIKKAEEKGYKVAWSNQCFEYWLFLHFNYSDAALHRDIWTEKLNEIFKQYNLGDGVYRKNYEDIYDIVDTYNGVDCAIKNAKRRMSGYDEKKDLPSEYDPGTTVYKLIQDLKVYLDE